MFLNGADPRGQPELRSASVRGQLRYWLRAVLGAQSGNLATLWNQESHVFGSTAGGSLVTIRLAGKTIEPISVPMLPHKANPRERSEAKAIPEGYSAALELVTRPGVPLPNQALTALQVWALLGGLGKRSRRMFGAVDVRLREGAIEWLPPLNSADAYAQTIHDVLTHVVQPGALTADPAFPTLHPKNSWVLVGKETFADPIEANVALFRDLLRIDQFRAHEQTFGQATGGRRSSPLIAQVRRTTDGYIPILTAMRSKPDRNIKWNILCDFMDAATNRFAAVTAWGGRFA